MRLKLLLLLCCVFVALCDASSRRVMVWMCLERCGSDTAQILHQLEEINDHLDILTAVSYEKYNLGPNSTLVVNNFTDVTSLLNSMGLETFPMVSSYPYPPQFLDWMRQVFANPWPFIDTAVQEYAFKPPVCSLEPLMLIKASDSAVQLGYTGFNVDWEPTTEATEQDAEDYAEFLSTFAEALHKNGKILTVDVAGWSNIWNFTLLTNSQADRLMDMSTYTGDFTAFTNALNTAVSQIGLEKLGVGLETLNTSTNRTYTDKELAPRFKLIEEANVHEIDIWKSPIPANWWSFLLTFVSGESEHTSA